MKLGKISEAVLKRSVMKQIRHRREEVLLRLGVGMDCAAIQLADDELIVMSTDPVTTTTEDMDRYAVHTTVNDIVSSGAETIGIMLNILLPEESKETLLKDLMHSMEAICKEMDIEIIGGHSEVTKAVNQPVITVTGVGKVKKDEVISAKGMQLDQDIVMTKWAGLEGTAILAKDFEMKLLSRYSASYIDRAKQFVDHLSVVEEAAIGRQYEVTAMHDVTEGGIFGALWEMSVASNLGVKVDLKKIHLKQETVEICEFFDLNPYLLMSTGCLLMTTYKGSALVEALRNEGIEAEIIGRVTESSSERVVVNEDEVRYLEPPRGDELYKLFQ